MAGNQGGHVAPRGAVVAQAQHGERIAQAGKAHANAAFGGGLGLLLGQRPIGQVQHIVQSPHLHGHGVFKALKVKARWAFHAKRVAHKARQDHRAQVATAVGGEWLFATVVGVQAIGVKGVYIGHGDVKHFFGAVGRDGFHRGGKALAVQAATKAAQQCLQACGLVGVAKAHGLLKHLQVVATDHQLVLRPRVVPLHAAPAVGQGGRRSRAAIAVQGADHAQAQQHALGALQQCFVALRQTDAHPFVVRSLHRAIGVKQAAQRGCDKFARTALHGRCQGLVAHFHAHRKSQVAQRHRCQAAFTAPGNRPLKTGKVGAVVERGRSGLCCLHHACHA